jgi:hypothetical protein
VNVCVDGRLSCTKETIVGPFETSFFPKIYSIEVKANLNDVTVRGTETWKSITVEIINENLEVQNGFNYDLYNEYWIEGGESGKEKHDKGTKNIRFDTPGKYHLSLSAESSVDNRNDSEEVTVVVKGRIMYEFVFIFGLGALLLFYIIFRGKKQR